MPDTDPCRLGSTDNTLGTVSPVQVACGAVTALCAGTLAARSPQGHR